MTAKILISACLIGKPVRYNGHAKTLQHPLISKWLLENRLVSFCPEISAGMPVPRLPAEISNQATGAAVLEGNARVIEKGGQDVTSLFLSGANAALECAQLNRCLYALLADGSPSCGSRYIHDGTFSNNLHAGTGVTTALLEAHGIRVFPHHDIDALREQIE